MDRQLAADLREILFALYDSTAIAAGGKECPLEPELQALRSTVYALVEKGILSQAYRDRIIPEYIAAARAKDGARLHLYGRMTFRDVVDRLQKAAGK